jgi:hypothetical protein
MRRCEFRHWPDHDPPHEPCGAIGMWLVARGRSYDAQVSCGRHLSLTIQAILRHDRLHCTVTRIT